MAKNTNRKTRIGAVKERSQVFNEKTNMFIKRNKKTGRFISSKSTPYKGVTKENKDKIIKSNNKKNLN